MRQFTNLLHLLHRLYLWNEWFSRWGSDLLDSLLRYQQDMKQSNHMEEEPIEEPKPCIAVLPACQPSNQKCHAKLESQCEQYMYDNHEERPLSNTIHLIRQVNGLFPYLSSISSSHLILFHYI